VAPEARLGTFDDLLRRASPGVAPSVEPIARKLREVILSDFPEAIEVVRLGDGAASFGVGSKKMSEAHVYVMPLAEYVNLGFYHGVGLPDPGGLLQGTGVKMRHVNVRSLEDAASPAVRALSPRPWRSGVLRFGAGRSVASGPILSGGRKRSARFVPRRHRRPQKWANTP